MLAGVNDSIATAEELAVLLHGRNVTVNLIPYNPTRPPGADADGAAAYAAPGAEALSQFQRTLAKRHAIKTTVRKEMGRDINGACGQLAVDAAAAAATSRTEGATAAGGRRGVADVEDLVAPAHAPAAAARRRRPRAWDPQPNEALFPVSSGPRPDRRRVVLLMRRCALALSRSLPPRLSAAVAAHRRSATAVGVALLGWLGALLAWIVMKVLFLR